ncbi:phage/plasmid replication protein, II/X family [Rhodoferax bucti]|uniref:phage/plasmid replication protein, II/X family n=1 Tax=Rhodoferax bucti TaxID=2576305 RepID=UPI0011081B97|nr:phage/plasmid replication protein, II/X family [Rhodoferax bucti]
MFKTTPINTAVNAVTQLQAPNIHIDRFRVTGPCTHKVLGNGIWKLTDKDTGEIRSAANAVNGTLGHDACNYYVRSRRVQPGGTAEQLEIHVCPPQILQKHNVFGHGNLVDYVCRIFDLLTAKLGIEVDPRQRQQWYDGLFWLTEVHLTANFACPHSAVLAIITAIDQNTPRGKHKDSDTDISLGFTKKRRSKYRVLTVYDKYLKLLEDWPNPGPLQAKIIEAFRDSIRVELKLYSQGLKYLKLQSGVGWRNVDIAAVYFNSIKSFGIRSAIQQLLTEDELGMLDFNERKVYTAWLKGTAVRDQFKSRSTANEYINAISRKTGIEVGGDRRPEALPKIKLSEVFSPANVLPVPDWAHGTHCYVPPLQ